MRNVVIGNGEEMIVGDFAGKDAVLFELFVDGFGIANDFAGVLFDRFLGFGVAIHVIDGVFEGGRGNVVEEASEGLFFVMGKLPNNEGDTNTVCKNGIEVGKIIEATIVEANHADAGETLKFGGGDVFEEPSGEFGTENFKIFAGGGGEVAERFVFAGGDVEGFDGTTAEESAFDDGSWFSDGGCWRWGDWGRGFDGGWFSSWCFNDRFGFWDIIGDWDGGFAAGGAVVNFEPILVEPKLNFVVAVLGFGGEFQDIDFGLFAAIEIANDDVGEFGDGAGTDVALNAVFVFVHEEESVGLVEVFIEAFVEISEALGVVGISGFEPAAKRETGSGLGFVKGFFFKRDRGGPVDDVVATTFEVASPIERALVQFGTAGNNEFFHMMFSVTLLWFSIIKDVPRFD